MKARKYVKKFAKAFINDLEEKKMKTTPDIILLFIDSRELFHKRASLAVPSSSGCRLHSKIRTEEQSD